MKGIMKGNSPLNITFDDRGRNKAKSTMKTTFGRTKGSMALPHGLTFDNSSQLVSKNIPAYPNHTYTRLHDDR